jgi:hypothetical protein
MWLQNFQIRKLGKLSYCVSGPNLEPNLLNGNDKNLENAAVVEVTIKMSSRKYISGFELNILHKYSVNTWNV